MTTLIVKVVGVTAEEYVESLGKDFSEALRGDLLSEFGILSSNGIRKKISLLRSMWPLCPSHNTVLKVLFVELICCYV